MALLNKLQQALDLILDDEPDNRDDTILAKLVDSIRHELGNSQNFVLRQVLKVYLEQRMLNNKDLMTEKESSVSTFFVNLVKAFLQTGNLVELEQPFLEQIVTYFEDCFKHNEESELESSVLCSIFELFLAMHESALLEKTPHLLLLINKIISEGLNSYLDGECKSIFVRKLFKSLLFKHLTHLQAVNDSNYDLITTQISRLADRIKTHNLDLASQLLSHFLFNLRLENHQIRLALLDKCVQFHRGFFTEPIQRCDLLSEPNSIEPFSHLVVIDCLFSLIKIDMEEKQLGLNELSAYVNMEANSILLYDNFLNRISSLSSRYSADNDNLPSVPKSRMKSIDLWYKFLLYSYSFLNKILEQCGEQDERQCSLMAMILTFLSESSQPRDSEEFCIEGQLRQIKQKVFSKLILPLTLKFNNNPMTSNELDEGHDEPVIDAKIDEGFLVIDDCSKERNPRSKRVSSAFLTNSSLEERKLHFSSSLLNLRLFVRKNQQTLSNARENLMKSIDLNQIFYLLRHLELELKAKNLLIEFLIDMFVNIENTNEYSYLYTLAFVFAGDFSFRLDGQLNASMLKLTTMSLGLVEIESDVIFTKVVDAFATFDVKIDDEFLLISEFLNGLLEKWSHKSNIVKLVIKILSEKECLIAKEITKHIQLGQHQIDVSELAIQLNDSAFILFSNLFASVSNMTELSTLRDHIFTNDLIYMIQKISMIETEAFTRREIINFLVHYFFCEFKSFLATELVEDTCNEMVTFCKRLRGVCNFFAYFLVNEFDWQVQLNCSEFLMLVLTEIWQEKNLTRLTAKSDNQNYSLLEIVFYISNSLKSLVKCLLTSKYFDKHVVAKCSQICLQIKQSASLMSILDDMNQKHPKLYEEDTSSEFIKKIKQDLLDSDLVLAVTGESEDPDYDEYSLKQFLESSSFSIESLTQKIAESYKSSDLYENNPIAILDDIISSYEFEVDPEKAVDCY